MKYYAKVDLFDQCPKAIGRATQAMSGNSHLGYVCKATMQSFQWCFQYNAIYMVWCAGYLVRPELVVFLRKAKLHLDQEWPYMNRRTDPDSHIILLDNVLALGEEPEFVKGQWVRQ